MPPSFLAWLTGGVQAGFVLGTLVRAGLVLAARLGPRHAPAPPFRPALALELFRHRGTRLAMLGYLGHRWERYAMWAWVGAYLAASFFRSGGGADLSLASFAAMAAGAIGCVAGGWLPAGPAFGLAPWLVVERLNWGGGAFAVLAIGPALGCLAMARLVSQPA